MFKFCKLNKWLQVRILKCECFFSSSSELSIHLRLYSIVYSRPSVTCLSKGITHDLQPKKSNTRSQPSHQIGKYTVYVCCHEIYTLFVRALATRRKASLYPTASAYQVNFYRKFKYIVLIPNCQKVINKCNFVLSGAEQASSVSPPR